MIQKCTDMEKRRLKDDLIALCNFLNKRNGEGDAGLFSVPTDVRIRGNDIQLHCSVWTKEKIFYCESSQTLEQIS